MARREIWEAWQQLMSGPDLEPARVLQVAAMYERYFQEVQNHAVTVARSEGRSWQEIADAVGISKQSAWERWRRPRRPTSPEMQRLGEFAVEAPRRAADVFEPMVTQVVDSIVWEDAPMRDELIEAGQRALVAAIDAHDESRRRVPFTIYASWTIRQAVTQKFLEIRDRDRGDR